MNAFEKLMFVEDKLTSDVWIHEYENTLAELSASDKNNILGQRKETLARVLSTLKYFDIKYSDAVLIEIGAGKRRLKEGGMPFVMSNIADYFIENKDIEYLAFDRNVFGPNFINAETATDEQMRKICNRYLFNYSEYMSKIESIINSDKLPVIFSNLVVGVSEARDDSITKYSMSPPFQNATGLHIHQYFSKDLINRVNEKILGKRDDELFDRDQFDEDDEELRDLSDETFDREMNYLLIQRYNLNKNTYSMKLEGFKNNSNTFSVWVNY